MARKLKVFAYYYPWYTGPEDSKYETNKDFAPWLGLYDSSDPAVIRQHCEWAVEYGLSGFLVEWFGTEHDPDSGMPAVHQNTRLLASIIKEYPSLQFAIFYDQAVRFGGAEFITNFTEQWKRQTYHHDFSAIAGSFFDHPQYLRIKGRPAVVIYLTRVGQKEYHSLLDDVREIVQNLGYPNPFLIGDEVWWKEVNRNISVLDAVTAYSLNMRQNLLGSQATAREYAELCADLYSRTVPLAESYGGNVIPHIGHAYNDGAFRGNLPLVPTYEDDHLPEYRQDMVECMKAMRPVWNSQLLRQTQEAFLFVNSWNEWPERSVIEPTLDINTWNELYDFRRAKTVYLPPPGFEFLEGIKEGREFIEKNVLPKI